ncbi:MAG: hypothetical protein IKK03_08760 [Lachnospiraceae bacterium]|nr:hypothetical protein [Lachnospiraceae bacterium]
MRKSFKKIFKIYLIHNNFLFRLENHSNYTFL